MCRSIKPIQYSSYRILKAAVLLLASTSVVAEQSKNFQPVPPDPFVYTASFKHPDFTLAAAPSEPLDADTRKHKSWLPWVIGGGLLVLILGALAVQGGGSDSAGGITGSGSDGGQTDGPPPATDDPIFPSPPLDSDAPPPPQETPDVIAPDKGPSTPKTTKPDGPDGRLASFIPRHGVFFSAGKIQLDKRATDRTAAGEASTDFFTAGYDRLITEKVTAGLFMDFSTAESTTDESDDAREKSTQSGFVFGSYQITDASSLSAYFGVANSTVDSIRFSTGEDSQETARLDGDTRVKEQLLGLSLAHDLPQWNQLQSTLRLDIDYINTDIDAFQESGESSLALRIPALNQESLTSRIALSLSRPVGTRHGVVIPQLGVDMIYESKNESQEITTMVASDPSVTTTSSTDDPDVQFTSANVGASMVMRTGFQFFINYEKLFNHDFRTTDNVNIGARFEL